MKLFVLKARLTYYAVFATVALSAFLGKWSAFGKCNGLGWSDGAH